MQNSSTPSTSCLFPGRCCRFKSYEGKGGKQITSHLGDLTLLIIEKEKKNEEVHRIHSSSCLLAGHSGRGVLERDPPDGRHSHWSGHHFWPTLSLHSRSRPVLQARRLE